MACQEGALLIGTTRPTPTLHLPINKPRPTQKSVDCVSFDNLELCNDQCSDEAVEALNYYFNHMLSLLTDNFTTNPANPKEIVYTGIIVSIPDALANGEHSAWEMLVIENPYDAEGVTNTVRELLVNTDKLETVLLYPSQLQRFTGVYTGVVVRIKGTPFKYDTHGNPSSISVEDIAFPARPPYSWSTAAKAEDTDNYSTPLRVHFAAGPFPRGTVAPIEHAIKTAALRGASALVLYGAFVPEVNELDTNNLNANTFDDTLNEVFDAVEGVLSIPQVANSNLDCVYFVPALNDINNYPVLPQPKLPIQEGTDKYKVVSNPTTITVGGITFLCSNYPSIDAVAEVMMDKWTDKQRLYRAGECVLRDRLAAPLLSFPPRHHDLRWLHSMSLMDDLEMSPPHCVVFSSRRDHAVAFVSHSDRCDLSDPTGDGAVVIGLSTTGRKIDHGRYTYEAVELTIPDVAASVVGGLGNGKATVTILNETCDVDL